MIPSIFRARRLTHRTRAPALALLLAACPQGDDNGATLGSGPTTTTTTAGSTTDTPTTGEVLDCTAINACLLHPDKCPAPCACDDEKFTDAICVTTEAGEYLTRCHFPGATNGLAGLCPWGCDQGSGGDPSRCVAPSDQCGETVSCLEWDLDTECAYCECGNLVTDGCVGQLGWVPFDSEGITCRIAEWCAFGCAQTGSKCCEDEWCL